MVRVKSLGEIKSIMISSQRSNISKYFTPWGQNSSPGSKFPPQGQTWKGVSDRRDAPKASSVGCASPEIQWRIVSQPQIGATTIAWCRNRASATISIRPILGFEKHFWLQLWQCQETGQANVRPEGATESSDDGVHRRVPSIKAGCQRAVVGSLERSASWISAATAVHF